MSIQEHIVNQKTTIGIAILAILILLGGFLYFQSEGDHSVEESAAPAEIGVLGAKCGGSERFPCNPGLICSNISVGDASAYGKCVEDRRVSGVMVEDGEGCDGVTTVCRPGSFCRDEGEEKALICVKGPEQDRPFIFSVIPENMELVRGTYYPIEGNEVTIRVRAVNVESGELYIIPIWSSRSDVSEEDRVATLTQTETPEVYSARFLLPENMAGALRAIMVGKDGQEAVLSINVASKELKNVE